MDKQKMLEVLERTLATLESVEPIVRDADAELAEALQLDIEELKQDIEALKR